jgi:putative flavoprotein involved in K+ transport
LPLRGDPDGYPHKDEIGDYLEDYAREFALPVVTGSPIVRLSLGAGGFSAVPGSGPAVEADAVVVATGTFQRPRVPAFAESLDDRVQQLDALTYRNPAELAADHVVVVGDGATGRQIALELARTRHVVLATGRRRCFLPQRSLGRDSTALALELGLLTADKTTPAGRLLRALDATPGLHLRGGALKRAGIRLAPRCVGAAANELIFEDGSQSRCEAVIWAAGYRDDTAWLEIEGAASPDRFLESRGVSSIPGLYYVGREWQRSRASGLICGVHRDARDIATQLSRITR